MSGDSDDALRIAKAIADENPVDWDSCGPKSPEDERRLEHLKVVESVASAYRALHGSDPGEDSSPSGAQHRPAPERVLFEWGHLKVLEKLGDGSSGEVFRAYDPLLDREVALKLWRAEQAAPAATRRRFIQEARRLARVRHPNVIVVHGADVHDSRVGLWTDLVTGNTLEQWLAQEGPLSAEETALIGLDLCRALAAVHAAGLVHGDVKTTNVMRERGGRIVLMDFGAGVEYFVDTPGGPRREPSEHPSRWRPNCCVGSRRARHPTSTPSASCSTGSSADGTPSRQPPFASFRSGTRPGRSPLCATSAPTCRPISPPSSGERWRGRPTTATRAPARWKTRC